ncbi:MAG TPA: discoidin domain-containing protein [Polyangiaceae bacterium]|nr:discoidin domain-containing protein [Polyangiaceae bacterium]
MRCRRLRAQVEDAVLTMRRAEQSEPGDGRVRLGRQALSALVEAYALSAAPCGERGQTESALQRETLAAIEALPGSRRHARALALIFADAQSDGSPARAQREWEALADLFAWLERRIDTRTEREIVLTRWARFAALAGACLGLLWLLFSPTNIARGKPVSSSSLCGYTPPAPLGKPRLERVVDGRRREPSFAVCTEVEPKPWVSVDLGGPHAIREVVVYPRADCCFGELALPIGVELSDDNQRFESAGTESEPATPDVPWRFVIHGRTARYVRISTDSQESRQVVVGEIEIYD